MRWMYVIVSNKRNGLLHHRAFGGLGLQEEAQRQGISREKYSSTVRVFETSGPLVALLFEFSTKRPSYQITHQICNRLSPGSSTWGVEITFTSDPRSSSLYGVCSKGYEIPR